jgi:hypothetical protein
VGSRNKLRPLLNITPDSIQSFLFSYCRHQTGEKRYLAIYFSGRRGDRSVTKEVAEECRSADRGFSLFAKRLALRARFHARKNRDMPSFHAATKSGGAPPHSKTQAKLPRPEWRPRFGVRQCSAAVERTIHYCFVIAIAACGARNPSLMLVLHNGALVGLRSKTSLNRYASLALTDTTQDRSASLAGLNGEFCASRLLRSG